MGTFFYAICITPLKYFIETVFVLSNMIFNNPGIAIIFVSIAVQLFCFPLYKKADDVQLAERDKQKEMERWVTHIKSTFKGDERFMMLQTYYREMGYKPIYALKGSISLFLQIPFFMAAYSFLSQLEVLKGVSFLGIADLSMPDSLIHIGSLNINLLPVLMTFFNIISGVIYLRGLPIKDKIQTYGLAALFLVLLYRSPSGLVFYWTLNNFFSLVKNVFTRLVRDPKKVIRYILAGLGVLTPAYVFIFSGRGFLIKGVSLAVGFLLVLPLAWNQVKNRWLKNRAEKTDDDTEKSGKILNGVFYSAAAASFALLGLLIPMNVIESSPTEFAGSTYGPFGLLFRVASIMFGFIFVWLNIFYIFSSKKIRKVFALTLSVFAVFGTVNYFCFGKNLGTITNLFRFDNSPSFSLYQMVFNLLIVVILAAVVTLLFKKKKSILSTVQKIVAVALAVLTVVSAFSSFNTLKAEGFYEETTAGSDNETIVQLSKTEKNVVVIMLDRAMSGYIPFMMQDVPELFEQLDGFTYYPNTLSFGGNTNFATPSLYGGYEYTPLKINERASESLKDKQNEALTVLPRIFAEHGFSASVVDPPYANYTWNTDVSIYDEYPDIDGHILRNAQNVFVPTFEPSQQRAFAMYNFMKAMPLALTSFLYNAGNYWSSAPIANNIVEFLKNYGALDCMIPGTKIIENGKGGFLFLQNSITHEPTLLDDETYEFVENPKEPDYNSKVLPDGRVLQLPNRTDIEHYQTNILALKMVSKWLNYLKENGVYDNTKIIIVADHGSAMGEFQEMCFDNGLDIQRFNPLLLVKDFDAKGFSTSDEFMTIADVATLATQDVIENPVNPFTNNPITNADKFENPQIMTTSHLWSARTNNGNKFDTSDGEWYAVSKNIFDQANWKKTEVNE